MLNLYQHSLVRDRVVKVNIYQTLLVIIQYNKLQVVGIFITKNTKSTVSL